MNSAYQRSAAAFQSPAWVAASASVRDGITRGSEFCGAAQPPITRQADEMQAHAMSTVAAGPALRRRRSTVLLLTSPILRMSRTSPAESSGLHSLPPLEPICDTSRSEAPREPPAP
jgi:hypothetical protein